MDMILEAPRGIPLFTTSATGICSKAESANPLVSFCSMYSTETTRQCMRRIQINDEVIYIDGKTSES